MHSGRESEPSPEADAVLPTIMNRDVECMRVLRVRRGSLELDRQPLQRRLLESIGMQASLHRK